MRSNPVLLTILCAALAATACRGGGSGDDDGGDDDTSPDSGVDPDDATIYAIQQGQVGLGEIVAVRGVIITAVDDYGSLAENGQDVGNVWVQEPEGGAYSGVLIRGIDVGTVEDLEVGMLVDIEGGEMAEFALTDDTSGRTTTQLRTPTGGAITVTNVGTADVPEPALVDALAIGQMADAQARDDEWEKWEGVLIRIENVSVLSELRQIGSMPKEPPFEEIRVTGPLRADTGLDAIDAVTFGECLASVTGIGDYFFNYKILPRAPGDIVHGGTGCPAEESEATACADAVDNDANGYADCEDNNCSGFAQCATSIVAIQRGESTGNVSLEGVVITGFTKDRKNLYVADAPAGAAYNGVYVYRGAGVEALGAEWVIGATVDIVGHVSEFDVDPAAGDTLTELNVWGTGESLTLTADAPQTPTGVSDQTAPTLTDLTTGEAYESVLVQLAGGWAVTGVDTGDRVILSNGTDTIVMDDESFDYAIDGSEPYTEGTIHPGLCYTAVTGIMGINLYDNNRRIYPREALDLVLDGDGSDCTPQ